MMASKPSKYQRPHFLPENITQEIYERWLRRKAKSLVDRDKKSGAEVSVTVYRDAIHQAVLASDGLDAYTDEVLNWELISQYDNEKSKQLGRKYKHEFALLPTVDHVDDPRQGSGRFNICSWRTNDAKHDLGLDEFIALCEKVFAHRARRSKFVILFDIALTAYISKA